MVVFQEQLKFAVYKVDQAKQNYVQNCIRFFGVMLVSGFGDFVTDYLVQRSGVSIMSHILLKA